VIVDNDADIEVSDTCVHNSLLLSWVGYHCGAILWSRQRLRQSHRRSPCGPSQFITQLLLGAIICAIPATDFGSCGRSGGMWPE